MRKAIFAAIVALFLGLAIGVKVESYTLKKNIEIYSVEETEDSYVIGINWTANQYIDDGHAVDLDVHEYVWIK